MGQRERAVSASDANRRFSELLRAVREGATVLVTSHGKPVARIIPATRQDPDSNRARRTLLTRLRGERVLTIGRWSRDDLYEDET